MIPQRPVLSSAVDPKPLFKEVVSADWPPTLSPLPIFLILEPILLHSTSPFGLSLATHSPILFPFPEIPVPPDDLPLILCLNGHFELKKVSILSQ